VFLANSQNVASRIKALYGRDALVVHPPIDTDFWTPGEASRGDYFLHAGRLVPYKRADVVVRAARRARVPLVVAGGGPELGRLKRLAEGADIRFVVDPDTTTLRDLYRGARALVYAGVEDFGMVLVEAQACGTPVVAFARGGALEAVSDKRTGCLYTDPGVEALAELLRTFDPGLYDPAELRRHAESFGVARFDAAMRRIVLG
jgi:glycosyltransferase involved in cell wall biosynthesis